MFDIGWSELLIIVVVTILVVGPKDLPKVLRQLSRLARKAREMAREFQAGMDELAREADLDDLRKDLDRSMRVDTGLPPRLDFDPYRDPTGPAPKAAPAKPEEKGPDGEREREQGSDEPGKKHRTGQTPGSGDGA
ncbi:MAG: Sec-independent protein translocase protein TatB [Alphaproteobacteria bacterium]